MGDQLGDWNAFYRWLMSGELAKYRGSYVAVYDGKLVAHGSDAGELRDRVSTETGVPSERLVISFVDPQESVLTN